MEEEIIKTPVQPLSKEVIPVTPKKSPLPVILLVILGLLTVAGAVYAGITIGKKQTQPNVIAEPTVIPPPAEITPTPDATANWKTYRNNKFKYEFKFPPLWEYNRGPGNISDAELSNQLSLIHI